MTARTATLISMLALFASVLFDAPSIVVALTGIMTGHWVATSNHERNAEDEGKPL